jgi:hypothetical protein
VNLRKSGSVCEDNKGSGEIEGETEEEGNFEVK